MAGAVPAVKPVATVQRTTAIVKPSKTQNSVVTNPCQNCSLGGSDWDDRFTVLPTRLRG